MFFYLHVPWSFFPMLKYFLSQTKVKRRRKEQDGRSRFKVQGYPLTSAQLGFDSLANPGALDSCTSQAVLIARQFVSLQLQHSSVLFLAPALSRTTFSTVDLTLDARVFWVSKGVGPPHLGTADFTRLQNWLTTFPKDADYCVYLPCRSPYSGL